MAAAEDGARSRYDDVTFGYETVTSNVTSSTGMTTLASTQVTIVRCLLSEIRA